MSKLTIRSNNVRICRFGVGMGHTKQKHDAAPERRGTWVWFDGFREPGMTFMRKQPYYPKISYNFDIYNDRERLEACWAREAEWLKVSPAKWHYGWIDMDAMVYVGWTVDGTFTRNGFFNSGEWNHLTMRDAVTGLRKIVAQVKAIVATSGYYGHNAHPIHRAIDCADLQVFVPKTTKIK